MPGDNVNMVVELIVRLRWTKDCDLRFVRAAVLLVRALVLIIESTKTGSGLANPQPSLGQ